jgi:molybdate transport system ATP-binding protein
MKCENATWSVELRTSLPGFLLDVQLHEPFGVLAVVGENGSGKTTLLRALMGAYASTTGKVVVGDRVLLDSEAGIALPMQARGFAYVPQGGGLFPHLSVMENVLFGAKARSAAAPERPGKIEVTPLLESLGCAHLAQRRVNALSGGEKQKVALARALMSEPSFLLLDEPLSALDVRAKRDIRRFLSECLSVLLIPSIVVTHDARDVDELRARVCVMESGRVLQRGTRTELEERPASAFVRAFCEEGARRCG